MPAKQKTALQGNNQVPAPYILPAGTRLIETMSLGVVYQDAQGAIIYGNPAAERILGLTVDQMMGRTSVDSRWKAIHEDGSDFPGDTHPAMLALKTGEQVHNVIMGVFHPQDEKYHWIRIDAIPEFHPGEDKPYQVYATFLDVTEQRDKDSQLQERLKELTTLYTFNSLAESHGLTEAEICQSLADNLPAGWQYIQSAVARVQLDGVDHFSAGFQEPVRTQRVDVIVKEQVVGFIEVGYTREFSSGDEDPFLPEEWHLLRALAIRLGVYIESNRSGIKLKATEARLAYVMASMNDGIILLDNEMRYVYLNQAAEEQGRRNKEELLGRTVASCWPGIETSDFYLLELKCNQEKIPARIESSYTFPDGQERWYEWNIQPLPDGLLLVTTDITEQHAAQKLLIESESRFRSLIDNMWEGVQLLDKDMRYTYINRAAEQQYQRPTADLLGRTLTECWPGVEELEVFQFAQRALEKGEVSIGNLSYDYPNGSTRLFEVRCQPTAEGLILFSMDITERQAAVDATARSEERYRQLSLELEEMVKVRTAELQDLYDSAPVGYHSLDREGTITQINATALTWLGYTTEEVTGNMKVTDLLTPAGRERFIRDFPMLIQRRQLRDEEYELVRKDGSTFIALINVDAVFDNLGEYSGARATIVDFSERKKIEEVLQRSRDELSQANVELALVSRAKDEFLSNMSHELRTPLTGVLGLTSVLLMKNLGELNDRQQDALQKVEESANRLLELVNDIIDYSKLVTNSMDLELEDIHALEIAMSALRSITPQAVARGQKTSFSATTSDVRIHADGRRFKQLLGDLFSNAVKFTPEGGELGLEVNVDEEQGIACFTVWDHGVGIRKEDLPRLYLPFTQLDSSLSRQFSGTGLGLALVARLVDVQGGSVSVESEPGKGSRFTVCLPMMAHEETEAKILADAKHTILLVDDQEIILKTYAGALTSRGFNVITGRTGRELVELLHSERPDAVVTDVFMPESDGITVLPQIRFLPEEQLARTPVIMMSAYCLPADRERYLLAGADEYIRKPVPMDNLTEILNRVIRDHKGNEKN